MPLISRNKSKAKKSAQPAGPNGKKAKQSNPMLLIGAGLALVTFVLFFSLANSSSKKSDVLVAATSIPPFSTVQPGQLKTVAVPSNSVTANDLTPAEFKEKTASGKALVSRVEILPGQRVDAGAVAASSLGSLAAVKDDERVVAMPATFPGAVAGVAIPGSVVDVYRADSSGGTTASAANLVVDNAKVLAVGMGADTAANVRPDSSLKGKANSSDASGSLVVVLAIPEDKAGQVVGSSQVWMALDPHYSFTEDGTICRIDKCSASGKRAEPIDGSKVDPTDPQDPASATQADPSVTTGEEAAAGDETADPTLPQTTTNTNQTQQGQEG